MSMGIEQFRSVATKDHLENRRITIEGQGQNKEIRAPNNLWGRFVDWVKGSNQTEQTQNKTARRTFFDALEKAYGRPIADRALENTVGLDGQGFKFEGTKLTAKTVKQVLELRPQGIPAVSRPKQQERVCLRGQQEAGDNGL